MVFIKDVALVKREREIASHRERIDAQLKELREVASKEVNLQKLKAISSNVQKLCTGRKPLSAEGKIKDRAYQKRRYEEKKNMILEGQKRQRDELRKLRESVRETGDMSVVSLSS